MYLQHLVERLGKYVLATFLPNLKTLAQKYVKRAGGKQDVATVLAQLLREVAQYRDIMLPGDEGVAVIDQHVRDAAGRIPDLDSLIEHTLQFRSMLISADQGNTVNINLNVPSTREFLHRVLVDVAEELLEDPTDTWLEARPQELRLTVLDAVKNAVDSYLPYIRKQLDAMSQVTGALPLAGAGDDLSPAGEGPVDGAVPEEDAGETAAAKQIKIKVSKGAAGKGNPKSLEEEEEQAGEEGGEDGDEFEDEADDDF